MPDPDAFFEPQDEAEAFDETHRTDELGVGGDDLPDEPDVEEDVYDVTSALGDTDDDDEVEGVADDDDEDLDDLELDEDEDQDEDDALDDDLEDEPEAYDVRAGLDRLIDRAAERPAPIEPGLVYTDDLDAITHPRDDEAEKYESTRPLSDEQIADLGYLGRAEYAGIEDSTGVEVVAADNSISTKPEGGRDWEERSFGRDAEDAILENPLSDEPPAEPGSGARAEDIEDEADPDEDERLDEGLEETFPASDPVSAKHIT